MQFQLISFQSPCSNHAYSIFVPTYLKCFDPKCLILYLSRYISSVEGFLLNLTMNKPWLTPEDFKPVNDRLERLRVLLLLMLLHIQPSPY